MNLKTAGASAGINIVSLTAVIALYTAGVGAGFFQRVVFAGELQESEQRQQEYTDRRFMMFQLAEDIGDLKKMIYQITYELDQSEVNGQDVASGREHIADLQILLDETEIRLEDCKDADKLCI